MTLRDSAQEILNLYNYFSCVIITDHEGSIVYYNNSDLDINSMTENEVIGKKAWDIFKNVNKEDSDVYNVLKIRKPVIEKKHKFINIKCEEFESLSSVFPIKDNEELIGIVQTFLYKKPEAIQHNVHVDTPKGSPFNMFSVNDIISESNSMKKLKRMIERVAKTNSTVLIYGETGAGKELVAQSIHTASSRASEKFISQNCAAIPGNLLESILFGTVKGSYTDAQDRIGLFEAADKGTLFLDEIHAMDQGVQAKLLKAVEEQEFYRVGGTEPIPVDVRIIAALNKKPEDCVNEGDLRNDLYYRLKVVELDLPSLRDRKADIDSLTEYFIKYFNTKMNKNIKGVTPEVWEFLHNYKWPGNVREMRNIIECAYNFTVSEYLTIEDIDSYNEEILQVKENIQNKKSNCDLNIIIQEYEKSIIEKVLNNNKNVTKAAEKLGISTQTLYTKIKNYSINTKEEHE